MNALRERTFKSDRLEEEAIERAFREGTERGNQDIVEEYCEHPAITSEEYSWGLRDSWNYGKPNQVFPFLLEQADQGDLDEAKKKFPNMSHGKFCQAIDEAPKPVPPAGSRHLRPIERARIAMNVLAALGHDGLVPDIIDIITGYAARDDTVVVAMKVLDRFRDPGIPPVISSMIAGYLDGVQRTECQ